MSTVAKFLRVCTRVIVLTALALALGLAGAVLAGPGGSKNVQGVIDFEGALLSAGDIISELSAENGVSGKIRGVIKVFASNGASPADIGTPNEAFKFKPLPGSPIPGPGVGDGGFPSNRVSEGFILIPTEDFDSSDPDDADRGGMFADFDFSMVNDGTSDSVTINSVSILDVEEEQGEGGTYVEFWTDGTMPPVDSPSDMFSITPMSDNGRTDIEKIKLEDVNFMRINMNGSAAILSIVFGAREEGTCWATSGGFQNAGFQAGAKDFTFGGNAGPPPSGSWEVVDHNSGDNFHTNDVTVVGCLVNENLTGPEQPGGKKGFEENVLNFKGTGRLREGDGTTTEDLAHRGCVIDAGEPSGKQGLDKDYYEIVVCKSGVADCTAGSGLCNAESMPGEFTPPGPQGSCNGLGGDVIFAACGLLDGGNMQLHPPTGKN
jgi:hypothetical protein